MRVIPLDRRCRPVTEWPLYDRLAWQDGLQDRARTWKPATCRFVVSGYGRWLTWLDVQGLLDVTAEPGARVTMTLVSQYADDLRREVSLPTVLTRVRQLGTALRLMAPQKRWQALLQLADDLRRDVKVFLPTNCSTDEDCGTKEFGDAPRRSLPFADWLAVDQAAWTMAQQPGDILDPGGVATRWADATCRLVANGYGHLLYWLRREDLLDLGQNPEDRVTRTIVFRYVEMLKVGVAPYTVSARLQQLGNAMRAIAPDGDWSWLLRAADRHVVGATSTRSKRECLRAPDELITLGTTLMQQAEAIEDGDSCQRATLFRDGLMIAFLAHRPIRRRNLAGMFFGQQLLQDGESWWVRFEADETKTHRSIDFAFPDTLIGALKRYVDVYRPILQARGLQGASRWTDAVWVSAHGTAMGAAAITHNITKITQEAFGLSLCPHLFRDAAATSIAINAPEDVNIIQAVLGHSAPETAERHYNLAGGLEASRRYAGTLGQLRQHTKRAR